MSCMKKLAILIALAPFFMVYSTCLALTQKASASVKVACLRGALSGASHRPGA